MINNDVLRRLRYALDYNDIKLVQICQLSGVKIETENIKNYTAKETDSNFVECPTSVLEAFLDGLIVEKRGPSDNKNKNASNFFNNNVILRKLKIAFEYKDEDILRIFKNKDFILSKSELSAFFRKKGHRNYKECGDQVLRNFLNGLVLEIRK
ncbi:DUF1456 family protein [Spirochaeta cellobiosiphila]|uniref:DUF1456 family protein n=1 Tax=Spirochaeta cellobiosiphila TaxID=504483 RepID=UPI00040DE385|nr:DUF1456 family protein [Spirochaeta cellobiosiphila]